MRSVSTLVTRSLAMVTLTFPRTNVRYLDTRLNFSGKGPAPFDSVVVICRPM
jgi:hypothetical protein